MYTNKDFESGVNNVIERFHLKEDHCDTCKSESNFIKVVPCQDIWRCLGCLTISTRGFKNSVATNLKEYYKSESNHGGYEPDNSEIDKWEIERERRRILAAKKAQDELDWAAGEDKSGQ